MMSYAKRMKIYFARHGRTNYNDLRLCNADPSVDVHLTSQGEEQAKTLADNLKDAVIDRIFVSELKRTKQTAEIVNKAHNAPIMVEPLLNDHRSGFEDKPFPLLKDALDSADNKWTARFNDGESIEDMKKRVEQFLDQLKNEPYSTVLVVTSQWIIQAAVSIIKGISNEEAWQIDIQQGDYLELEL